jgi:cytochrome c
MTPRQHPDEVSIMNRRSTVLTLGAFLLCGSSVQAAGVATKEEAQAMAIKAAAFLKANGPEKAFAAFAVNGEPWHDRDLYVTVLDSQGVAMVHGNNPGLNGKSLIALKDVDGKAFIREMVLVADAAWVDFKWQNPVTKAVEPKTSYEIRVGDYVVGVGAYSQ